MKNDDRLFVVKDAIPKAPKSADQGETVNTTDISRHDPFVLFSNCLVDYSGRQFSCVHGHCMNQKNCLKTDRLHDRLYFQELHFHPADRALWCDEVFPDIFKFMYSEANSADCDYRFIFNHRYIKKDSSVSQFMHEGSITFEDETWLPVLNLNVFFEIADIKADTSIVVALFRYSAENGFQKVFSKSYGGSEKSILSKRELEIISLCSKGMSSKMIAEKLNLSIHTVKNHKRNCMEKTMTHNITELIHHCTTNNWLQNID